MNILMSEKNMPPLTPARLAIWGWWHGKNLGDNWIRQTMQKLFPAAEFINTYTTDFSPYDFVICGGGGLFVRNVPPPWDGRLNCRFGVLGLGAEFPHSDNCAHNLEKLSDFFYVRDTYTVNCMRLSEKNRSYDITFANPLTPSTPKNSDMDRLLFIWREPGVLLNSADFVNYIGPVAELQKWNDVITPNFSKISEDDFQTTECYIDELSQGCGFIISARYHGIIAAIQRGIPCIGIDLCPKTRALMEEVGLAEYCLKIADFGKLPELVRKAKTERCDIIRLEQIYCKKATELLSIHLSEINKIIRDFL